MKAAVLYGNNDIRYEDWPEPQIMPGTVKVRVMACGICGSDVPRVLKHGAHFYPIVLGHEFSGYITEVGTGVSSIKVGDHVAGVPLLPCMKCENCQRGEYSQCKHYSFIGSREQGAFADYVVLPEKNVVKVDPALPYEQVALFEPCTVALHGLKISNYKGGKTVAILGGGTIGLFALQWAKIFGAGKVIVFGRNPARLEHALALGADHIISTLEADFLKKAEDLTDNRGFDYIYETAGSTDTIKLAFQLAANKAQVCLIGTPSDDLTFTPSQWETINRKEFQLTGSWMSCSAPFPGSEWKDTALFWANGKIKYIPEMVLDVYDLCHASYAFSQIADGGNINGRMILKNID